MILSWWQRRSSRSIDDQRRRNAVEGKIGEAKRRYGLGLIREKLSVTRGSTIAMNVLVMNLQKLLELLFVLFAYWLQLLLSNERVINPRISRLSTQISPA